MARAYASHQPQDYGHDPQAGEWQALRGELVSLLDQVEDQVARTRQHDHGYQGIAERMRDLRYQVSGEPDTRHREALRSVQRAVNRFNERDEPDYAEPPPRYSANPRDTLESAIRQIRARHGSPVERPSPREYESPRLGELAHAVGGISGRLERLEAELRNAAKVQTGNVKEIAEQVAQLSHVVELLAGAVGETGQVKRLEAQIGGLAKLVSEGSRVDLSSLTRQLDELGSTVGRLAQRQNDEGLGQRLDDVSATVGRLADLQVQFANRVDNSHLGDQLRSVGDGLKEEVGSIGLGLQRSMDAIEEGIRSVYDRIDAIERQTALDPAEVEKLTDEMARVTEALKNPQQAETIIELVESIHRRIGEIESPRHEVGDLKLDFEALRTTVAEAIEPRFAALEMQIEALNERVAVPSGDISVGQLEAQVRQLVARMDQTGEQLTGLARLYSSPPAREPAPDFEALADLVASRTSEAVAQHAPTAPIVAGLGDDGIEEIERRVSRLLAAAQVDRPNEDLTAIEASVREVNDRLARLELSLSERAQEESAVAAAPVSAISLPDVSKVAPEEAPVEAEPQSHYSRDHDPIAPLLAEAADSAMEEARGTASSPAVDRSVDRDVMPTSPAVEAPLRDRPFGDDDGPVKAALEAKNGPRKRHPGLTDEPPIGQPGETAGDAVATRPEEGRLAFDPATIERPPRPISSFDTASPDSFAELPPAATVNPDPVPERDPEPAPGTNTFIAAARRAAQRQQQAETASAGSGSIIARAFASFQQSKSAPETGEPAQPEKKKRGRMGRLLAGDKVARTEWKPEQEANLPTEAAPSPTAPEPIGLDKEAPPTDQRDKESFLSRHRRPILLAAAVIAVALLTLNLINQRLGQAEPEAATEGSVTETSSVDVDVKSPLANAPVASMPAAISGPRVIPIVDSLATTASIDPAAADSFTPAAEVPEMPLAFSAAATEPGTDEVVALAPLAADIAPLGDNLESPVTVEMPPEGVGPEPLRRAASDGDARAQFEVAAIYTEGRAVKEDLAAAAVWYERAAAQGFAPAQYRLGNLYEHGRGVTKDLQQAKLWYQRAAEAGNRMAMHNLAALYASGELGKQEFDAAAEWFKQAAMRGMRDSQFNLGMLHARGLGVPQSLEESYKWFSLAALRGDPDAAKARDDIARSLDAEAVSRLDDEVAAFSPAAIELAANFAPIGTWTTSFDPGESITNGEVIKSVQLALNALGYDVGTPDGLIGPRTKQAIRDFERATGMSESGAVNPRLLAVLGSQPV